MDFAVYREVICYGNQLQKDMKKKDLEQAARISHYTIGKLNRGDNVTTEVLAKICIALGCTMDDIMEIIPDYTDKITEE